MTNSKQELQRYKNQALLELRTSAGLYEILTQLVGKALATKALVGLRKSIVANPLLLEVTITPKKKQRKIKRS